MTVIIVLVCDVVSNIVYDIKLFAMVGMKPTLRLTGSW